MKFTRFIVLPVFAFVLLAVVVNANVLVEQSKSKDEIETYDSILEQVLKILKELLPGVAGSCITEAATKCLKPRLDVSAVVQCAVKVITDDLVLLIRCHDYHY